MRLHVTSLNQIVTCNSPINHCRHFRFCWNNLDILDKLVVFLMIDNLMFGNALSTFLGCAVVCGVAWTAERLTKPVRDSVRRYGVFHGLTATMNPASEGQTMDTATVYINNFLGTPVSLLGQVDDCEGCALLPLTSISAQNHSSTILTTAYDVHLAVHANGSEICSFAKHLWEYGKYDINISAGRDGVPQCSWNEVPNSHSAYVPIYVAVALAVLLVICHVVGDWLLKRYRASLPSDHRFAFVSQSSGSASFSSSDSASPTLTTPPPKRRLQSLDCFRGITIMVMIFANCGGGGYWFFNHTIWNGLTIADCVFPWFLFIMGVAINISMRSASRRTASISNLMISIIRRTALLFLFGLLINSINYKRIEELRLLSVLGRFSISYFVVAMCELLFATRIEQAKTTTRFPHFRDIVLFWPTALISMLFPFTYLLFTFLLKSPGCPAGYVGPGGLHNGGTYGNCTGGAAGYIDKYVLGESHIYQWPTCRQIYRTGAFDPEGILGYLNSIFMVFLGVQAGRILYLYEGARDRLLRLVIWGVLLGLIAGGLCGFSKNDGWIPVNKNLWSLSFILTTASFGMLILAALYYLIDVKGVWTGTPFHYPSVNSIVLYIGSEILDNTFPFWWNMPQTHSGQLFMALWSTSMWWLISFWMYRQKIFIAL